MTMASINVDILKGTPINMDGAEDEPDGLGLRNLFRGGGGGKNRSGNSKGFDSAYNSHDTTTSDEEDTQQGKTGKRKKPKKKLKKTTVDALSVRMTELQISAVSSQGPFIPQIDNEPVKIKAQNCTDGQHCDGLLTMDSVACACRMPIGMVTAYPIYPVTPAITFTGRQDDKYSTQLWIPKLWHDKTQIQGTLLQIGMLSPFCSGQIPEAEMDEENLEVTRIESGHGGQQKIEREADTGIIQSTGNVDPKLLVYPYRLTRVKQQDPIMPIIAAVHIKDAKKHEDIFGIDWKLTVSQDNTFFTLQDIVNPMDGKSSSNDLYLAGTNSNPNPFLVKQKNHWDFLQNPMVKLSIFSASDA